METKFNVFEIFEIAEKIEHNSAMFYLQVAERFDDPERSNIYYKLANWKAKHEKTLAEKRKEYSEKTGEYGTFDPNNYVLSNPQVMAGLSVFGTKPGSAGDITGHETKEEIIKNAIGKANQAISFYSGLKEFAKDAASEKTIDEIIREENRHIDSLSELLKQL